MSLSHDSATEPYYCAKARRGTRCTTTCSRFVHGGEHCGDTGDDRTSIQRHQDDDCPDDCRWCASERYRRSVGLAR